MQVFFAFTLAAHNSMPWLTKGRPHPGRPDALILDAPVWHHWPQLLIWLPFQGSIIYLLSAWAASEPPHGPQSPSVFSLHKHSQPYSSALLVPI